jgi:hypothetical protein
VNKLYFIATDRPDGQPDTPTATSDDGSISMFEDFEKAKAVRDQLTASGDFPPLSIYGLNTVLIGKVIVCS